MEHEGQEIDFNVQLITQFLMIGEFFPLSGVTVYSVKGSNSFTIASITNLLFLTATFLILENENNRSVRVTKQAFPVLPATVSASQSPILVRLLASSGLFVNRMRNGYFPLFST